MFARKLAVGVDKALEMLLDVIGVEADQCAQGVVEGVGAVAEKLVEDVLADVGVVGQNQRGEAAHFIGGYGLAVAHFLQYGALCQFVVQDFFQAALVQRQLAAGENIGGGLFLEAAVFGAGGGGGIGTAAGAAVAVLHQAAQFLADVFEFFHINGLPEIGAADAIDHGLFVLHNVQIHWQLADGLEDGGFAVFQAAGLLQPVLLGLRQEFVEGDGVFVAQNTIGH